MAEILSSFVKPAMEELGRITFVKIKHLFTYLCCFNSNIQSLRDEAQKLENARVGLQRVVEEAQNNAEMILPEVQTWLENGSNKIHVDKKGIEDEIPTVKNGCWGVKSRFLLSRKVVKITREMKQLMEEHNKFNHISTPPIPAAQAEIPLGTTYEFQSRKQIEEEIVDALRAKEVTTMGICGMGGVGKTTMAKRIMDRMKKENIFQEIFMVVVSQQLEMLKIQGAIAESLGLKLDVETLEARATMLRARVTGEKRILIVFDDVWEKLKLEDLGIPCGNERCTIVFTSRNKDVLEKMEVQKVYGVEILSDDEAWILFKEKVGACVDATNLLSTAKKVARECKGLPIALITVGGALKNRTDITVWKDALQQLQNFNPQDIPDVIKEVYNPLKLSYTKLDNRRAQSLFLLCSLFPEDFNISLEELTSYCMGLRIFPNFDFASDGVLERVRGRVSAMVDMLKNRFLLLNGRDEYHVRMHDVVRDVAIYIASHGAKEEIVDVKLNPTPPSLEYTYQWVSVFSEKTSTLLRMHGSNSKKYFEIKDLSIFDGIKELNLLSFQYISLRSLPLEIQFLKNLRTLRLEGCKLESLSVVGELLSLEILSCHSCPIQELPVEIGYLNQLKLLDFTRLDSKGFLSPGRIPPGVVSKLVNLEKFKMFDSFDRWELAAAAAEEQGGERRNACLNEFEKLSKLTCLEIEINDFNLAGEEISFSPNIDRYHIVIGHIYYGYDIYDEAKSMCVYLPSDISVGSWVLRFMRSADWLHLAGDGVKSLDLPLAHNKKSLRIEDCSTVKEVVNSTTTSIDNPSEFDVFQTLECLQLINLPNLEEIYDGPVLDHSNSFANLKKLKLVYLPALKHLWKQRPNTNIVSFDKLREIEIWRCENLQNLFSFPTSIWTELCTQKEFFPMLKKVRLERLDKLEVIWNFPIPEESNSFRNLRELTLFKNVKDISLSELPTITHLWKSPNLSVSLSNLSKVYINKCPKLHSVFSCTMPMEFLSQLVELKITACDMMEQVLLNEENRNDENQCRIINFSKLSKLELYNLDSLTAFGKGIETIAFPMLEDMIINCPKLMSLLSYNGNNQILVDGHDDDTLHLFCGQKISFGNLKKIFIWSYRKENLWCCQISASFFIQIEELEIFWHRGISLFSFSIAVNLINLKKLKICNCKEMEKLIKNDEDMVIESIVFPVLEDMKIENCPKLMSLISSAENNRNSTDNHDNNTFHLFCNKTISFSSLKRVSIINKQERNMWCQQIPAGFFCKLEELTIDSCSGIERLFSFSLVENLVNIKKLKIGWCNEMEKVIDDDEEMLCKKPRILFPSLKELELRYLSKLKCFCNLRDDLQLPLLEQLEITRCPLLEFFTIKPAMTPNLKSIYLDWDEKEVEDLNGAIKLHFEANQAKEESTSTKESEAEAEHEKSEIEEEEIK